MIQHKGYTGVFEYDPEYKFFAGRVVDLRDLIYFEGESVKELRASMARAVDAYLEVCEERGDEPAKPFSGQFRVRMESALHQALSVEAAREGISLNSLVVKTLSEHADA